MLTEVLLTICIVAFLYLSYKYAVGRPKNFPPGPPRLPIVGSYLFLLLINYKYLHKAMLALSKWYKSDIIGLHLGKFPVVVVHDAKAAREMLNNTDCDGRAPVFIAQIRDPGDCVRGIFFQDGTMWKEQRRFILRYLRDYGFGRRYEELELIVKEEITDMLNLIRSGPQYEHEHHLVRPGGYRIQLPLFFNPLLANCHFHILHNERRSRADMGKLVELIRFTFQFERNADDYGRLLSIIPWIRHIWPNASGYAPMVEANKYIYKFFSELVDRHLATYDDCCDRNFLDIYIREMKKCPPEEYGFNRAQFIMGLADFSFPAYSTTGTQLSMLIQYLLLYPHVAKRIQSEIDEVVGCGRLPTLEDRKDMSYTEATIREIMRIETIIPSNVPHRALTDMEILGYSIPKNTLIIASLYACNMDKRIWHDPENFRPERFLDENGKLCPKLDLSLSFSAGKRICVGETFSRNMIFLMLSAVLQHFDFVLAPGDSLPDPSKNHTGLIVMPNDFWVQLQERVH